MAEKKEDARETRQKGGKTIGARIKNAILDIILVICLIVAGCCGCYIYTKLKEYKEEEDYTEEIREDYSDTTGVDPLKRIIDWEALLARNPDVKGWLYIPGTAIDEPVMIGDKDNYYLHKNLDKQYMYAGQLFLDYRNSGDFDDDVSIIYGHNMRNGSKFHNLRYFLERDTFDEIREVYLYLPDSTVNIYRTFASAKVKTASDFYSISIDYDKFIPKIRNASTQYSEEDIEDGTPLLMLSTCYGSGTDWRTVLYSYFQANVLIKS